MPEIIFSRDVAEIELSRRGRIVRSSRLKRSTSRLHISGDLGDICAGRSMASARATAAAPAPGEGGATPSPCMPHHQKVERGTRARGAAVYSQPGPRSLPRHARSCSAPRGGRCLCAARRTRSRPMPNGCSRHTTAIGAPSGAVRTRRTGRARRAPSSEREYVVHDDIGAR